MQKFLVLASILATAVAQYPDSRPQYGVPSPNAYLPPQVNHPPAQQNEVFISPRPRDAPIDLKVFRHVFVHSAPNDEPQKQEIRRIRGPGGDEKHVNVIFVKAPAPAAPDQQVVDVQNDGGRKTLVYVLLKKAADAPDVKFSGPAPTKPSKPEVYFIRYKDPAQKEAASPAPVPQPSPTIYSLPAQPQETYGTPAQTGYSK
ncbi:unnamed protein product [Orchesella dallaii]|uniref:DUF243 domain-containing protein n=1 Tax=Orchesella dallaii TaxID=48710 RepID=A0ABP1RDG2_9HEXA